jgi:catechol 2,3-dioxygenase-like lactoylglutathione lyase family enzyme
MPPLLTGAHAILYSRDPEADRAFLRDVLGLPHVDIGDGWLIFSLPPAELAVHPASRSRHELYLMCADIEAFVASMQEKKVACSPVQDLSWGRRTQIKLPGGGKLGIYEPRHARP